jgi:hypothetical protein
LGVKSFWEICLLKRPVNIDILIVTFQRDFEYLKHCLRSIGKFATGFSTLQVLVPNRDLPGLKDTLNALPENGNRPFRDFSILGGDEWPDKGMTWHMAQIMHSDEWCPTADFVIHVDSDCIFTAPVTPATFIKNGKPILQYERFESIGQRHPGVVEWQKVTQNCLPFDIHFETMRQHGETYSRATYAEARKLMQQKTGQSVDDYIRSGRNAFPQEFCEFVTLGNVAIHCFPDKYHLVDNALKENPDKGDFPIGQFWSHGAIDLPQDIWWEGVQRKIVPITKIKSILG